MSKGFTALYILILIILVGLVSGIYYFSKSTNKKIIPVIQNTSTDETSSWKKYTIKNLGLSYKLPPAITVFGELEESVNPGQKGTQLLISTENSKVISDEKFLLGTTSLDYMARRGGMFIDMQGFKKTNGKYYAKFIDSKTIEIPNNLVSEVPSIVGLQVIKIKGQDYTVGDGFGLPVVGTPGEGKIGALINISKLPYQGLAIQMDLTQDLTEQLFEEILSTLELN